VNLPVVIAVAGVGVVEVPRDQVVRVVAVRHRLVTAPGAVGVRGTVGGAVVPVGAGRRVGIAHLEGVLIDVVVMGVMEVAVMEVVDVPVMRDNGVPAVGAVDMVVSGVRGVLVRGHAPSLRHAPACTKQVGVRNVPARHLLLARSVACRPYV